MGFADLAENKGEMLARLRFVEAGGPGMVAVFDWFRAECGKLKRPGDVFPDIPISVPFAGKAIVERYHELMRRERVEGPYRERVVATPATPEDEMQGKLYAAFARYQVEVPALSRALENAFPRQAYLEWLDLTEGDLVMMPHGAHPNDPPEDFDLALGRRITTAWLRWRDAGSEKREAVPRMMAERRARAEAAAREQRLAEMERRIAELEARAKLHWGFIRGKQMLQEGDAKCQGSREA